MRDYTFGDYGNQAFLQKNYDQRLAFYISLSNAFINEVPGQIDMLERSIKQINFEEVQKIAHRTKNNYHWMGLHETSQMLKLTEESSADKSLCPEEIEALVDQMKLGLKYVIEEHKSVQSFLDQNLSS